MTTETSEGTAEKRSTYRELFAIPAIRVLFTSSVLGMAADTLRIVAMSMLVLSLTGSPLLSAIAFGIGFLPELFGGVFLGSLADRIRPRLLMWAGYAVEAVATAAIALLPMPIAASLAIIAVTGALQPAFSGAASRLTAELLPGDLYVLGRSVSRMAGGGSQLVGLAFGGLAVAAFGPQRAMLAAAAAHLICALIIRFRLSNYDVSRRADQESKGAVAQSWHATRVLLRDTRIRGLLLVQWLPPAFVVGAEALIVAYADLRGFPTGSVGLLLACIPAGMFTGHLVIGRFLRPETRTRLVAPLIGLLGALVSGLALAPPMWSVGAILYLTGAAFAYSLGLQRIFVDATPEDHRGQAFVLLGMGLMTFQGLGPLVFGTIAQTAGIRAAMALAGAACVVTALVWWRRSPI